MPEERTASTSQRQRAVLLGARLGVVMLASGAQTEEVRRDVRRVVSALGFPEADVEITYGTVMVASLAPDDPSSTTALRVVRDWNPDFDRLAAASALVRGVTTGGTALAAAERDIDAIETRGDRYPRWLRFIAPAVLSTAVTILFGGSVRDALATLAIGLAIQPVLERIDRSELPEFFQVVVGVATTVLLVVLLVKLDLPIRGSLVLTGSLLRFLPGASLVSGMHDLISGAFMSGVARLAEVVLISTAIAGAAAVVLTIGARFDVDLRIATSGRVEWPALVVIVAGAVAVVAYAIRVGAPAGDLASIAALGALAAAMAHGLTPLSSEVTPLGRTLIAAIAIGVVARILAHRRNVPAAIWAVPAILPLLPSPTSLLPLLADTPAARDALEQRAVVTAFAIGVGVASGDIVVATYLRYRDRLLAPIASVSTYVTAPADRLRRRRAAGESAERGRGSTRRS